MKKVIVLAGILLLVRVSLLAGDGDYAVGKIPLHLLKGANAVIRLEEQSVEMKSLGKLVIRDHYVITILNEKADKYAHFVRWYDKFKSIESIDGTLYDADGNKIRSLKKNSIQDLTGSDESDVDDHRVKVHNFYYKVYPYTVEYDVEITQKETMFFPQWRPVLDQLVSIEKSNMFIEVPADYNLRFLARNYKEQPVVISTDKIKQYSWKLENYEAIRDESFSPGWKKFTPSVMLGSSDFEIDDYKGKMTDWKEFGLFQLTLNKDRDVLPEKVKQKVHELVKDTDNEKEKINRLYRYLQQNTRYISIQLGIGGWKPFDANFVGTKGYGDCKALSNYMYALLKEAGIKSYYTLIRAGGDDDIETNFPSGQFNHVILCVPGKKDTTWLECTSQTQLPGYMGKFTGNRHALLVTEDGGKIATTPFYGMNDNIQDRNIKSVLNEDGTLQIVADTRYHGLQQDYIHSLVNVLSKEKIKEILHEELDFATYDISQFNYKEKTTAIPSIEETLNITVSNYANITGRRLFIVPNVMNRNTRKLTTDSTRKYPIRLDYEYKDIDSVEIELPKGYTAESIPQDVSITSNFGKYNASVKFANDKLYYYRVIEHYSGSYPASEYAELVKFYEAIYKADRNKVVLVKN